MMSQAMEELPPYEIKTLDGRVIRFMQSVDRYQHPIVVIDTFDANMQRQSTVKLGFKDILPLRTALQSYADAMLNTMCDY